MCEMCQTWTCLFVAEKVTYYCINKCNFCILCYINGKNIMRTRKYLSIIQYSYKVRPKKNICVFTVTCQKNLGSVGINFLLNFLLSAKPEIVVPESDSGISFSKFPVK